MSKKGPIEKVCESLDELGKIIKSQKSVIDGLNQRIEALEHPWISVDERLPEKGEKVDIILNGERAVNWYLDSYSPTNHDQWWYSGRSNLFDVESVPLSCSDITHWMPIPKGAE